MTKEEINKTLNTKNLRSSDITPSGIPVKFIVEYYKKEKKNDTR